jgi:hypothetical protein
MRSDLVIDIEPLSRAFVLNGRKHDGRSVFQKRNRFGESRTRAVISITAPGLAGSPAVVASITLDVSFGRAIAARRARR